MVHGAGVAIAILLMLCALLGDRAQADVLLTTPFYAFTNGIDGANPQASLMQASDGNIYGTTSAGGSNNFGTIFRVAPDHTVTPLYSFTAGNDGANPAAGLTQASDGNLYGTTMNSGSNGAGTIFRFGTNGPLTPLYSFTGGNDGGTPMAGLVQANDGNLYGTTHSGGSNSYYGTVFRISTNGVFKAFYSFTGGNDGGSPFNLVIAADSNLYGVNYAGGSNGAGTIFRVKTNSTVTALYSFMGGNDGGYPEALTAGANGNFYGTTYQGGSNSFGSIFKFNTNGILTPYYSFTGGSDGSYPEAALLQTGDGSLYGTAYFYGDTFFGGSGTNHGSIFRVSTNGSYTSLYSFSGPNDGAHPYAGLLLASDGTFYGTTSEGGKQGYGTVLDFQLFPTPVNDNFTNRSTLAGFASGYNYGATLETKEPAAGGGVTTVNNTVWWTWTAPTNGPVSVLAAGSSFDAILDVYTGNVLTNLTLVASNLTTVLDNDYYTNLNPNAGLSNRVSFTATAGTHYQIQVSGLKPGTIDLAAQTTAIKVISYTPLSTNADGSVPFNAQIQVGNSGLGVPGPLQIEVLARAGSSFNTANFGAGSQNYGPPDPSLVPPDQILTNYYLANPATAAPGTTTNLVISGVCPGPVLTKQYPTDSTNTLGFGFGVFVVLNEQFGTNWFFDDNVLVFYGTWPKLGTVQGPQQGVTRLNPGVAGSTPVFQSAQINGPQMVNQNSKNNYFGTANFVNGATPIAVNFTNTAWTASRFAITNGVFQTGSVATNTVVTLTALYSYNYYDLSITNTNRYSVLVLKSPVPSLGSSATLTNHNFALSLSTLPSSKYIIDAATNLTSPVTWTPLATNTTDTNGNWSFTDPGASNRPARYYRARSSP